MFDELSRVLGDSSGSRARGAVPPPRHLWWWAGPASLPRLLAFLALLVAMYGASLVLLPAGAAQAGCLPGGPGVVNCDDNVSGGVIFTNPPQPYTTLNVNNLTADINPASGTPGIKLTGTGNTPGKAGCDCFLLYGEGEQGENGGAAPTVTIKFDGSFGAHAISTTGNDAHGIVGISYGGNGGEGGDGWGAGGSGGNGGNAATGGTVTVDSTGNIRTQGDKANGILALSVGGTGGQGGDFDGLAAFAGNGGAAAGGGSVNVTSRSIIVTTGNDASGIVAQSTGGKGGAGGNAGGLWAEGGGGGRSAPGGQVTVSNYADISTGGTYSYGILAQSIGGFGGAGGSGGGLIAFGEDGGSAGDGNAVIVTNNATIETDDRGSHGIFAQSIGGGGGAGGSAGGLLAIGAGGSIGGHGGTVTVNNDANGLAHIKTDGINAKGIVAQSIGGGGGDGGNAGGLVAIGGSGSATSNGSLVTVNNGQNITTNGAHSDGIYAQSVGGGGGNGGTAVGFASIGGSGGGGGNGGDVRVTNSGELRVTGEFSRGIVAQSVGGGGGDGGMGGGLMTIGGAGAAGGEGRYVNVVNTGAITANGNNATGILAQSIGGGGGDGGGAIAVGVFVSAAFGGHGGEGGKAGNVDVNRINPPLGASAISTTGDRAVGILAQSIGGGGGSGGFTVSGSGGPFGSASIAFGGGGGSGGAAGNVWVGANGTITTNGSFSSGLVAEAIGGGGGSGGFAIAAAGSNGVALTASFGGSGGKGGAGGVVDVVASVSINAGCPTCTQSNGILASSIGGGGGSGGFAISATVGLSAAIGANFGGDGGDGNEGKNVNVTNTGTISTQGEFSNGILAQSVGGGGGNGGFAASAAFSMAGGNANFNFGGAGGMGSSAGVVTVDQGGNISTAGNFSNGILAQSVGGGGGNGGFAGSLGFSLNGASLATNLGGTGGDGSDGGVVEIKRYDGEIRTTGNFSSGILAQSVGGGGGTGGFSVAANGTLQAPAATSEIGGDGGNGGESDTVTVHNITGTIITTGEQSHGIVAQSIAGGGGTGGFSIGLGFSLNSDTVTNSVGGKGGLGGVAGDVIVTNASTIDTGGEDRMGVASHGILAQSIGGGGGTGGFSGTGSFSLKGSSRAFSTGGSGNAAGDGSSVTVTSNGHITTRADSSVGIFAQSVGGGGGAGGFAVALGGSVKGDAANSTVGGNGGAAGNGGNVTVNVNANVDTFGNLSHGVLAQSVGGGGGFGGFSIAGTFSVDANSSSQSVGGKGDGGGFGSNVEVTVGSADALGVPTIHTYGYGSIGVLAQSIGGGGGAGGFAGGLSIAADGGNSENDITGGRGGDGSYGGDVTVTNYGTIITEKNNAAGILAQSVGGGGGVGGFSVAGSFDSAGGAKNTVGGNGGGGSRGGEVTVTNAGSITTHGDFSHGIYAQSVGGGGGTGGFSVDLAITTGGDGAASAVGGSGGTGGDGGKVTVINTGTINATGQNSMGIYAQSVGGSGGSGGITGAFSLGGGSIDNLVGGDGAAGGNGGEVYVESTGSIYTSMVNSSGVFAQSVGGSGGWAGLALGIGTGGGDSSGIKLGLGSKCDILGGDDEEDPCDITSLIPIDGSTGKVTVKINGVENITEGELSYGMIVQAIAGGGGSAATVILDELVFSGSDVELSAGSDGSIGGNAGFADNIYNTEHTETAGVGSIGVIVQSIGGGGGTVGNVNTALVLNPNQPPEDGFYLTVGGIRPDNPAYNHSGSGGGFRLDAAGTVDTAAANAIGIIGQTIGGGGGIVNLTVASVENEGDEIVIRLGGNQLNTGGEFGHAGAPPPESGLAASTLTSEGNVTTQGVLSHGIVAQAIGGGGGVSNVVFGTDLQLTDKGTSIILGSGTGGAGGNGSDLVVNAMGVSTSGAGAFGIVAQSIGGGGGLTGIANGASLLGQVDFSLMPVTISAGGGAGGDGGITTVNSKGDVHTFGYGAHGIVAQSIGGGGGIVGNGMFITTLGDAGAGPFAGTVGGAGTAAAVNVTQTRNIVVAGSSSVGIFGQSAAVDARGNVTISIDQAGINGNGVGLVWASFGDGAAVQIADGNVNALNTNGTLYAQGSLFGAGPPRLDGMAVLGGDGDDTITNLTRNPTDPNASPLSGITRTSNIIGNIDLGGGTNRFVNEAGALFISDASVILGTGELSNAGFVSPSDRGRVGATTVTGDMEQLDTGAYYIDIDLNAQNTPNLVTDLWDITGAGAFAGEGPLLLLSINKAFSNDGYVIAHAAGGMTETDFTPTLTPPAVGFIFSAEVQNAADLVLLAEKPPILDILKDPASGTTDPNVWRMGENLDNIEQAISIDDEFNYLINLLRLQPDAKALGDAVNTLTPHQAPHLFELADRRTTDFLDRTLNACGDSFDTTSLDAESCIWAAGTASQYDRGVVNDSPTTTDTSGSMLIGGQAALTDSFTLGLSGGYTNVPSTSTRHGEDLSTIDGPLFQAGIYGDYKSGNFGVGLAAAGSTGAFRTSRHVQVDGFEQTYTSFDGIATGVDGVGELPVFSEKIIAFEGIDGYAVSDAQIYTFNPRLRLSYATDKADNGTQFIGMLDIDGHAHYTPERTETGVGLANLTYPEMLQTAVTLTPSVEVRLSNVLDNGYEVTGFVRAGAQWSPWKNEWVAEAQFVAAPDSVPPVEIIEPFDDIRGKLDVGFMITCATSGLTMNVNYSGTYGATTVEHQLKGGLSIPIDARQSGGGC